MNSHFIKEILIKKVRHHENVSIPICSESPKHLIITGKNGSGKTSLLEGIKSFLTIFENYSLQQLSDWREYLLQNQQRLQQVDGTYDTIQIKRDIEHFTSQINNYCRQVELSLNNSNEIASLFQEGKFLISYFNASRLASMLTPSGIQKIHIETRYPIERAVGDVFVQYLVDLKARSTFAKEAGHMDIYNEIENWFSYLEINLRHIFENEHLQLVFDYSNYNFVIEEPGKEPYTLNSLSSGFSSILAIVTDLIVKMENNRTTSYDLEGIAIIDEIETHLHISLQKKILKFLTDFFPNIQFIVSTHSPFVINSIENAVVYDLQHGVFHEDFSNYSYRAIVEEFLGVDQYSYIIKEKLNEYEELVNNYTSLNAEEKLKLEKLSTDLDKSPDLYSDELKLKKAYIDLQSILSGDKK
ncbi:AAA family ATPase [Bacillus toyonensis]|uniref:AAA family ATPase n=1 Tax=Bacillus toyonensis TaxID=155322 RepID=UPI0015CF2214|nr:ATP-binding protein [Bacillus toyonensis]